MAQLYVYLPIMYFSVISLVFSGYPEFQNVLPLTSLLSRVLAEVNSQLKLEVKKFKIKLKATVLYNAKWKKTNEKGRLCCFQCH